MKERSSNTTKGNGQRTSPAEKGKAEKIFRICLGHSPLNMYLQWFKDYDLGKCDHCKTTETVVHFLLHYPHFKINGNNLRQLQVRKSKCESVLPPIFGEYHAGVAATSKIGLGHFLKTYTDKDANNKKNSKARPTS